MKDPVKIGIVSISDRASSGTYEDKGLPALKEWLTSALENDITFASHLIPDERPLISQTLLACVHAGCSLVLTTGGTGPALRDVTPEATLATVDINDDGTVKVFGQNQGSRDAAVEMIMAITAEAEVGAIYTGKVARIVDFGAFITILPGKDGLLHISQIANERVENVSDYLTEGQDVTVKCLDVDQRGRIKLSIKELLEDEAEQAPAAEVADESPAEAVAVESDAVEVDAVELEVESEETEVSSEAVVESDDEASKANDGTESEDDETK